MLSDLIPVGTSGCQFYPQNPEDRVYDANLPNQPMTSVSLLQKQFLSIQMILEQVTHIDIKNTSTNQLNYRNFLEIKHLLGYPNPSYFNKYSIFDAKINRVLRIYHNKITQTVEDLDLESLGLVDKYVPSSTIKKCTVFQISLIKDQTTLERTGPHDFYLHHVRDDLLPKLRQAIHRILFSY